MPRGGSPFNTFGRFNKPKHLSDREWLAAQRGKFGAKAKAPTQEKRILSQKVGVIGRKQPNSGRDYWIAIYKILPMKHEADQKIVDFHKKAEESGRKFRSMTSFFRACQKIVGVSPVIIEYRTRRLIRANILSNMSRYANSKEKKTRRNLSSKDKQLALQSPLYAQWKMFGNPRLVELYRTEKRKPQPSEEVLREIELVMLAANPNRKKRDLLAQLNR